MNHNKVPATLATHHLVLPPHLLYECLQRQEEGRRVSILIVLDYKLLKIFVKID